MAEVAEQEGQAPRRWPPLAVEALRGKIVEKVKENRVTLIVGDTGCGKSSMVPQFLVDENMEPILCTQPRRFAVVAIAQMIAESRKCQVGEEVGYHIGHSNVSNLNSKRSKIVFKTAGVVLEQMRDKGIAALKYKVIILDEVHERSVESDLVLACVKQFMMKKNDLRLVLMSATADILRYKEYFRDIGRGERVEVIAIPSSPRTSIFQRKVMYLEQIVDILKMKSESLSTKYCSGPDAAADAGLKYDVYELIDKLLLHIHLSEPDIEKSILVFLPTYYALEQQWIRLLSVSSTFKVHILHRSIDTDEALQTMKVSKSCRKVILATNIAESSVTIPGVAYVIDSCRSLQVYWDPIRKTDSAGLVWVSKSQAEQRKGRTGRTCDGQIYRLVTGPFYNSLNDHEYPAILRLSLKEQVLMICCAESRAMNDPSVLLQKVLDPPDSDIVEDALDSLVQIHALDKPISPRGRYEPTFYGCLLNSLPLSFDASVLTLKFGEIGSLHEGILISIMLDIQPLPILQPFGYQALCKTYRDNYFEESGRLQIGKKEATLVGNLCAFQFWQRMFKDKYRLEYLKNVVTTQEPKASHPFLAKHEEEWCAFHNLVPTALNNISEMYDDVMSTLHRFRPSFLCVKINPPMYLQPSEFHHTCLHHEVLELEDMNSLSLDAENPYLSSQRRCAATPYVSPTDFGATTIVKTLKTLIKEMKTQHAVDRIVSYRERVSGYVQPALESEMCVFFVSGSCTRGDTCRFSHSSRAPKPVCKFFLTLQGCRNGNSCSFSHDCGSLISSSITSGICSQEDTRASSLDQMDGGGAGCRVKVVGQVERVDGRSLTYAEFVDRFMKPNLPVVLTGLTSSWRSCEDWTLPELDNRRRPNLEFFAQSFPSPLVQVADCSSREFTDQKRLEMSMQEFVDHWVGNSCSGSCNGNCEGSLLYLKDWHFVKEYPGYVAYTTPTFFVDDWLNMYLDSHPIHRDSDIANHKNEINCTDYRFVYMGAKGTWTPLHADVFRSYSWSANVCGRKLWLFLPPSQSHLIFDRNLRSSVYNINDVSEKQFPNFNKTEWLECIQVQNEIIFVPSGWYHQVHNLEDTISINHNWFNAYNLHWVWNLLHEDYKVAKEYIEDIRDICDDFEGLCQRNLAANTGMNFYDFFIFITRFALANVIELHHIQKPEDAIFNSAETAHHFVYNLMSIRNVASKMISTEAFSNENLFSISEENQSAFLDVIKILEEKNFRRLSMALSKAYEHIDRGQRNCHETRASNEKGCLSVMCLKSDCNVVDHVASLVSEIHGPDDLVRLIDGALSDG